jgi:hypothetical protein
MFEEEQFVLPAIPTIVTMQSVACAVRVGEMGEELQGGFSFPLLPQRESHAGGPAKAG